MTNSALGRDEQIDSLISHITVLQPILGNDRGLLRELLDARKNSLGETTVHTVVHGRRPGEEASFEGRIGPRIGRVAGPGVTVGQIAQAEIAQDDDGGGDGPAVQISIWVRR